MNNENAGESDEFLEPEPVIEWGTAHPHRNMMGRSKVPWPNAEFRYIGKFCSGTLRVDPAATNLMARCLRHIKRDPAACRLFHPHHTLDSARLRAGYERWRKHYTGDI